MDAKTQFMDMLGVLAGDVEEFRKRLLKLEAELGRLQPALVKGDVKDRDVRIAKLEKAKAVLESVQGFLGYATSSRIAKCCGALEILYTLLDGKDDDSWRILETNERLSPSQTVDWLTDAITEYLLKNNNKTPSPKSLFVDNPDSYVAQFVASHLDHDISDRMSDMVISLVMDWILIRLS
ncbi:MAG: hypothetical protein IJU76_07530 [Desulfovibrionaceae bacterium]|nr:hypothetical protein [Desulfovibrionaceae bacterium]